MTKIHNASEHWLYAGDNTLNREEINRSIISKATANEHSFREASMAALNEIPGTKKTSQTPSLAPVDSKNSKKPSE